MTTRRRRPPPALLLSAAATGTALLCAAAAVPPTLAGDWPTWGRDATRNMVSPETGLPDAVTVAKTADGEADLKASKGVAWTAKLGSQTYGNPVVAGGRVYVGTNNANPRDPKYAGDRGVLMCLDEKTGNLVWQLVVPKLPAGRNVDWEDCGVCSSPAVDGDRVYAVTNRCEVVALDAAGLANGNDGATDEAAHAANPGEPPVEQGPTDADVVWRYDLRRELGVFPHFQAASNPLVVGDRLYVVTSNGVDWTDKHVPAPYAPALVCLDKKTGKLLAQERSGISGRTFYCNWSAPAFGDVGGRPTLVFGGGDGFLYGFEPEPDAAAGTLKELWRIDCNPPGYRSRDGKPVKYRDGKGPSEIIATPVIVGGKVYVPIGQDPEHGTGAGALSCVTVEDKGGKPTPTIAWQNAEVGRSMSTPAVLNGLIVLPELAGIVHCLDAATGAEVWRHDVESNAWGSALVADGRAYVGNESGELVILAAGRQEKLIGKADLLGPVFSTPVAANGTLFVSTGTTLYALKK
ncbi:MAG: outer rane biosis protein BamB [Phycisphaerales bacterium]|nr:outer rane biosis protein BamB [Phycisphaerales bacterium]